MAVGVRGKSPPIDDVMSDAAAKGGPVTLVVCPEIEKTDNLGAMIRIAAAFGATAMILGEHSLRPLLPPKRPRLDGHGLLPPDRPQRRPRPRPPPPPHDHSVQLVATVLDDAAENLDTVRRPPRLGMLFGNEAQGLSPDTSPSATAG